MKRVYNFLFPSLTGLEEIRNSDLSLAAMRNLLDRWRNPWASRKDLKLLREEIAALHQASREVQS